MGVADSNKFADYLFPNNWTIN